MNYIFDCSTNRFPLNELKYEACIELLYIDLNIYPFYALFGSYINVIIKNDIQNDIKSILINQLFY